MQPCFFSFHRLSGRLRYMATFLLILSPVFFFVACNDKNSVKVAILHTNDTHGKIKNMPQLAALKKQLQSTYDTVLLISAGDIFSGNPYVDYYNPKGYPMIALMNQVGYNLAVLGNHEFDYGIEILADRIEQANFPFISTNMEIPVSSKLKEHVKFSHTIAIKDILIEFAGMIETNNHGKPSTHPQNVKALNFKNAHEQMNELSMGEESDLLVLINHLGFINDSLLAVNYPDLEIIIGGHSHTLIDSIKLINDVLITQAGDNLEYAGLVSLSFEDGQLTNRDYKLIKLAESGTKDLNIDNEVNKFLTNPKLTTPICRANQPLKDRAELGYMITDAQMASHDIDFAFHNYWGIRIDEIDKGPIDKRIIYEMDPFNNELIILEMTEEDIKSLIAYSYSLRKNIDLFLSGGSYSVVLKKNNEIDAIKIRDENSNDLDKIKRYKVGLNSYISDSYKFSKQSPGKGTGTFTAENIINYLEEKKVIEYLNTNRVEIVKAD